MAAATASSAAAKLDWKKNGETQYKTQSIKNIRTQNLEMLKFENILQFVIQVRMQWWTVEVDNV